jgi:hypothetical protein
MTRDERFLFIQAAQNEFQWLAKKIVCDGRDPDIVAFAMTEKLALRLKELEQLWENRTLSNSR